jgi:hypothetical protein
MSLSERNPYEVWAELVARIDHLEQAVLLLQQALDQLRAELPRQDP